MDNVIVTIVGSIFAGILASMLSPLFEQVKTKIALRSVEKKKSIVRNEYAELSKAISELDHESRKRMEQALIKLNIEMKSVHAKSKFKESNQQILKEINEACYRIDESGHVGEKVAIALPILPILLSFDSTLNLSSSLENVMPAKQAAEQLKLEALTSGSSVIENVTREVVAE